MPLHEKIAGDLRHRIEGRELQAGDLLPSEADLCTEYSVSRSTVRQALAALEASGLVRKAQGRGSVVASHPELHRDLARTGLSLHLGEENTQVSTEVLEYDLAMAPDSVPFFGGTEALRLVRRRSSNGEPFAVIRTWLPRDFAKLITRDSLVDASLHERFASILGRAVAGGRRQVRAVGATAQLGALLETQEGTPLLLLEGESVDREGSILESFQTWHRGDLVAFDVDNPPSALPTVPWLGERAGVRPDGVMGGIDALEGAVSSIETGLAAVQDALQALRRNV